ncbi:MAG: hypothetical protein ACR2H9_00950 [Longimicrobiaceae bacterium]
MNTMFRRSALVLTLVLLAACGRSAEEAGDPPMREESTGAMSGGMQGMPMQGMSGMQGGGMMEQMQSHMQMMEGASGDSLGAMMPMHRQMTANMIARFNREMRDMNMAADGRWNATVDSLRQDLVRMPEMNMDEMRALMPAHHARVTRLMEMHRGMMGDMEM